MRIWPEKTVDQEFADLGSAGWSGTLNDRQFAYLRNAGYTGGLADMMFQLRTAPPTPPAFTPASIFTGTDTGFWAPVTTSRLWQDVARTTPVTAVGQSVASWELTTRTGVIYAEQSTAGGRPVYAEHPTSGVRNFANGSADPGGALWSAGGTSNGITVTRVASGTDTDGLPYADYSVAGTATAVSSVSIYTLASRTAATLGQTFTVSVATQRIGGSAPPANCGIRLDVFEETAPSTLLVGANNGTGTAPATETVQSFTYTLANAAVNQTRCAVTARTENGATVNYTIRIKALQFERGAVRTAYQFNFSQANITEAPFAQVGNLLFDGIDDFLQTPAINFSATDKVTVIAGVRKLSDAARGVVVELGNTAGTNAFVLDAPGTDPASNRYRFVSGGSVVPIVTSGSNSPAPDTAVLTGLGDISGDSAILRRNGVQVGQSTDDQGTGNYSNAAIFIGRRGGTTLPFNGVLTFLCVINRTLTAGELAALEAYANSRTGAY